MKGGEQVTPVSTLKVNQPTTEASMQTKTTSKEGLSFTEMLKKSVETSVKENKTMQTMDDDVDALDTVGEELAVETDVEETVDVPQFEEELDRNFASYHLFNQHPFYNPQRHEYLEAPQTLEIGKVEDASNLLNKALIDPMTTPQTLIQETQLLVPSNGKQVPVDEGTLEVREKQTMDEIIQSVEMDALVAVKGKEVVDFKPTEGIPENKLDVTQVSNLEPTNKEMNVKPSELSDEAVVDQLIEVSNESKEKSNSEKGEPPIQNPQALTKMVQSEKRPTNQFVAIDDLQQTMNDMAVEWTQSTSTADGMETTIQLTPEHLGKLDIRIQKKLDGIEIGIVVETVESKDLIEKQMEQLKPLLELSNLDFKLLSNVKLEVTLAEQAMDFTSQFDDFHQQQRNRQPVSIQKKTTHLQETTKLDEKARDTSHSGQISLLV